MGDGGYGEGRRGEWPTARHRPDWPGAAAAVGKDWNGGRGVGGWGWGLLRGLVGVEWVAGRSDGRRGVLERRAGGGWVDEVSGRVAGRRERVGVMEYVNGWM